MRFGFEAALDGVIGDDALLPALRQSRHYAREFAPPGATFREKQLARLFPRDLGYFRRQACLPRLNH